MHTVIEHYYAIFECGIHKFKYRLPRQKGNLFLSSLNDILLQPYMQNSPSQCIHVKHALSTPVYCILLFHIWSGVNLDFAVYPSEYCSHNCPCTRRLTGFVWRSTLWMNDSVLRIIFGQMCAAFFFFYTLYAWTCFFWAHSIYVIISAFHIFRIWHVDKLLAHLRQLKVKNVQLPIFVWINKQRNGFWLVGRASSFWKRYLKIGNVSKITDGDICLEAHCLITNVQPERVFFFGNSDQEFLPSLTFFQMGNIFQKKKKKKKGETICFQRNVLTPKEWGIVKDLYFLKRMYNVKMFAYACFV